MNTTKLFAGLALALGSMFFTRPTAVTAATHSIEWIRQLGTSSNEESRGVSANSLGNVFITGFTDGSLGGTSAGGFDAFLVKISDPIPEPTSLVLGAIGLFGLLATRRRKK